jgi:hypothetical protein
VRLVGLLLAVAALTVVGGNGVFRGEAAVESSVRRYCLAVTAGDLEAALAEIAPAERETWRGWLGSQLGNIYDVRGIGVRSPSVLDRLAGGATSGPQEVTVVLDVNRGYADEFYQPTSRVSVESVDGRWYLRQPLLAH